MGIRIKRQRARRCGRLQHEAIRVDAAPTPFKSNDELIAAAIGVFRMRGELSGAKTFLDDEGAKHFATAKETERRTTAHWHRGCQLSDESVSLVKIARSYRLNHIELEVLVALLLQPLGLWERSITDASDVQGVLALTPSKWLTALRALSESGKLYRRGLLYYDNIDEDLHERNFSLDPNVVEAVLHGKDGGSGFMHIKRESELSQALAPLTRAMQKKSDKLEDAMHVFGCPGEFRKWRRKQSSLLNQLGELLRVRPTWKLARLKSEINDTGDWIVLLALVGKALGHVRADDKLFTGAGLARAACNAEDQFNDCVTQLMSSAPLVRNKYIHPCVGSGCLLDESTESVQEAEFELTEKAMSIIGLDKVSKRVKKNEDDLRTPRVRLSDLVLTKDTAEAVSSVITQARNVDKLMKDWGLGESFPYGAGTTLLFYGPPGTGKTATAEAIAHELERPLLAVDYSKIQNCYVGQTEKNIMRIFSKAKQQGAVLFWDEADAMFFDRDQSSHAWEVRDVNVLLQAIERFEGVCILATNREATLDKALERRISAKVEFPRPTRELRAGIWRKQLPKKLPLAKDVDLDTLISADLSGGEIKNVILIAARLACTRSPDGPVTRNDFAKALDMETTGRWSKGCKRAIGFGA